MKLKKVFQDCRIVALAGIKNSGKSNNLVHLILDYRKHNNKTPIFIYGMPTPVTVYLRKYGVREISSIKHLVNKRDCLLIIDEFQKLKLNDRRYKEVLDIFVDFIYHNNVYCIFSTPNIREFNSVIGGVIEKWLLKSVRVDQCINGSQLKKALQSYEGRYKVLGSVNVPKNELLVINDTEEILIHCPYIEDIDTKKTNINLF